MSNRQADRYKVEVKGAVLLPCAVGTGQKHRSFHFYRILKSWCKHSIYLLLEFVEISKAIIDRVGFSRRVENHSAGNSQDAIASSQVGRSGRIDFHHINFVPAQRLQ